jgi:hypothetical protein
MEVPLASLWLPILLSAVAVFVVSSILHMVLPLHRKDYRQVPNEAEAMAVLRKGGVAPGLYYMPWGRDPKEMSTPEMVARLKEGPVGILAVMPSGPMNMGKFLGMWFVYCLLVGLFVAYLLGIVLAAGTEAMRVFRVATTAAFLAYCLPYYVESVWHAHPWGVTLKNMFGGLLYALAAGAVFAWLWPG